ncbi:MAG: hypothetical protein ACJ8BF_13175 [Gemmatimonadales bacterium]
MSSPLVIKFGGDALAVPERIALAARRVARRLERSPVVAVASARRGVTDHLLGLVEQVKEDTGFEDIDTEGLAAASDRAVAAGELVSASLLAVALNRLGVRAQVLDARQAGLHSDGEWTRAQLTRVRPDRITRMLRRGVTPVVTGFQGWHRGQVTTLGRGGSDTSAVALAAELGAPECELVKHAGGLFTADPKVVPDARHIPRASHRFLSRLAEAGAKVMALRAAVLAERKRLALRLTSLEDESLTSRVSAEESVEVRAVASRAGYHRFTALAPARFAAENRPAFTAAVRSAGLHAELEAVPTESGSRLELLVDPGDLEPVLKLARRLAPASRGFALVETGVSSVTVVGERLSPNFQAHLPHSSGARPFAVSPSALSFLMPDGAAVSLVRSLHRALFGSAAAALETGSPLQPQQARIYVGY